MSFFNMIIIIVLVILIIKFQNEINRLRNHINFLDGKIRDLYDKAFYLYDQIKHIKGNDVTENKTVNETADNIPYNNTSHTVQNQNLPTSDSQFNPYRQSKNTLPVFNDSIGTNKPVMNMNTAAVGDTKNQGFPISGSTVNNPVKENVFSVNRNVNKNSSTEPQRGVPKNSQSLKTPDLQNAQFKNSAPQMTVKSVKKNTEAASFKSFENWIGTRLFNIAASLMIFIGLILFCTLGYEYITNTMKMAAMFIVSGGFIALGVFFTRQNKSIFSLGLMGCGFGAFFISILLSHAYFHAITDVAAFVLLLVWSIFALILSKRLDSVMLSVTAHMGTAVSICFVFSLGFSAEKVILPVAYQFAAIAVIVIGNVFCCKKTYRFGLFMSLVLLVYTSIVMYMTFSNEVIKFNVISPIFTTVIFAVQFLAISFISYLISISTAALETEKVNNQNINGIIIFTHILNKTLWTAGIITSIGCVTYLILKSTFKIDSLVYPALAICFAVLGHLLVTLFMSEKLNFNERLSKLSIWFISIVVMLSLFVQAEARETLNGVPFLCVYIGLVMLIIQYTKNKALNHLVAFLIGCEMIFMGFYGYFAVANVVISIIYMAVIGIEVLFHWFMQGGESRERRFTFFKITEYLWLSVSIIPINVSEFSEISLPLILSEFALMNIITNLCKYGRDNEPELKLVVKIESLITVYFSIFVLAFEGIGIIGDILAIKIVFIILSAALTALYVKNFAASNSTALQVLSAVTVSGFITAFFIGFRSSFDFANIYTNVLRCKPFFFISAIILLMIYRYNQNHELRLFIWYSIAIDMFLMSFFGYSDLISEYSQSLLSDAIAIAVCVIHSAIVVGIMYYLWKLQNEKIKSDSLIPIKIAVYFWINISIGIISVCGIEQTKLRSAEYEFLFAILTLIHILFYVAKYNNINNKPLNIIFKVVSSIIIYFSIGAMQLYISNDTDYFTSKYIVRIALILLTVGLYYIIANEILKSKSVILQAYVGLTATLIVNSSCKGLSTIFTIQYIFSIITLITALICIAVGFAAKTKGLRVYGLIVVMLCVIKLVTFDIRGADSMSRVAAFIVGGIVCFIISGIYNKIEGKINE